MDGKDGFPVDICCATCSEVACTPTLDQLAEYDSAVEDEAGTGMRLKDALEMCPLDECPLPHRSTNRAWWRYGWAWGYLGKNLADGMRPVREKRFRIAIGMGYARGAQRRIEADAAGLSA